MAAREAATASKGSRSAALTPTFRRGPGRGDDAVRPVTAVLIEVNAPRPPCGSLTRSIGTRGGRPG